MIGRLMPALCAAVAVLAACTGVPKTSSAQVVRPVNVGTPTSPTVNSPALNGDARTMVNDFLSANALVDDNHATARGFLTADATSRWSDDTVSVVDALQVGNPRNGAITVQGRKLGTVSASGIYTPVPEGDATGGVGEAFTFQMKKVRGQWRIDALPSGLILKSGEFQSLYRQRKIFFYDRTERHLVPDPRFTALTDPGRLAKYLLSQLIAGPRPQLQAAWTPELPAQSDPRQVSVVLGSPTLIEVPGSSRLSSGTRDRLAAQLALTLDQVVPRARMSILDNGKPVTVSLAGSVFTAAEFAGTVSPANTAPALFYLRDGAVVDASGRHLRGELGTGADRLTSVALASQPGSEDLLAAGTAGAGAKARLLVGTELSGLHDTGLSGLLSRPTWAPNLNEVWVGSGSHVYRVTGSSAPAEVSVTGAGPVTGRVRALRFSPEGSRVAMVLSAPGGDSAQVWVGAVVRTPGQPQVRVDSLEPITPQAVVITDVAWNDSLKLFVIGRASGEDNVYEVQVDGSLWTPRQVVNLPGVPDSITVSENVPAWVSVDGTVWTQTGGSWSQPGDKSSLGDNPIYLE
ncbi:MAG: LpqB family beta-propeller domain-containing protein [Actinomycetota bacterium]|nr:LpqB family beta-propeller domain-containing protein [Actinomycetota bacterium]